MINTKIKTQQLAAMTIDVEDWFHILDSPTTPTIDQWGKLESRVEKNMQQLLLLLKQQKVRATFFWLGWMAQRHKRLIRKCAQAGHEIASHGYGHVLAYKVGPKAFYQDVIKAKRILEDIIGERVNGFRAAGFSITNESKWAFDVIRSCGHTYDTSVFPAPRNHGGMTGSNTAPHIINTSYGQLVECPTSVIKIFGRPVSLFGGGYLRLAPKPVIKWGIEKLKAASEPLIIYVHPREIDPDQPRLPLTLKRQFKCYVNLKTTMRKLKWICKENTFCTMGEIASKVLPAPDAIEQKVA